MVTWDPVSNNPLQSTPEIFTIAVHFPPTNFGLELDLVSTVCDCMVAWCTVVGLGLGVPSSAPVCPSTGTEASLKTDQWGLH